MELIPAIDLKAGRCVRLYQGDFDAETVYATDPSVVLDRYLSWGATRVHVVDLDGAKDGEQGNLPVVAKLAQSGRAKFQVGGGLRTLERVQRLLAMGIERAVLGSVAASSPDEVISWMSQVDASRLVFGFDVRLDSAGVPHLTTHGWRETTAIVLWDAVERYSRAGIRHVLCTDVARDGVLGGPNVELYAEGVRRFPDIAWQASGGVANAGDLHELADSGVSAVISGKALLENKIRPEELRPFLPNASSPA
jgi:phosphoribosylformimino-5-aminoimidazole carboxamide ribotide isomerase